MELLAIFAVLIFLRLLSRVGGHLTRAHGHLLDARRHLKRASERLGKIEAMLRQIEADSTPGGGGEPMPVNDNAGRPDDGRGAIARPGA